MGVKAVLTKQEFDAADAALKPLYKQDGERFIIDADGLDTHPFASSLRSALDNERGNRERAIRELNELKGKLGDLTPEDAVEARRKIRELEEKANMGEIPERFKEQFEKAVGTRTKSMQDEFENQKKAFERRHKELETQLKSTTETLATLTIDGEVRKAASEVGMHDWAIEDAVLHARQVYRMKDGKPIPMNGDQIIYAKNATDPKPISEWLSDMVAKKPGWVRQSTGGGANNNQSRVSGGKLLLTREQARDVRTYREAEDRAKKEGLELVVESPTAVG